MRENIKKAESRREAQKSTQPEAIFAWARGGRVGANFGFGNSDFGFPIFHTLFAAHQRKGRSCFFSLVLVVFRDGSWC